MHQYSGLLRVNLSALRRNWRLLKELSGGASCGAVVKANAYGLGIAPIAQTLYSEGCRDFFVATFDEALQVKRLLPDPGSIYVLQGCYPGMEMRFVEENLLPVLISQAMVQRWLEHVPTGRGRCVLKVNTGMNRLGISLAELQELLMEPERLQRAGLVMVMSHLACADQPDHESNRQQLAAFQQVVGQVQQRLPQVKASLANSAGVLLGHDWHFDLARPGIALYGGECVSGLVGRLAPVVSLLLPVMQLRRLNRGESLGYGCTFVAPKPMRVALVAGGYADGVLRCLSNRAKGWFGRELPLLGRVSMDSCCFDISHLEPGEAPCEGDFIELFGNHLSLDAAAKDAGTISYELLTRLGERLQHFYFEDPSGVAAQ
jgi:alanine racemase